MKNRQYDLVIMGATGFTGKLVVKYLLEAYGMNHPKFSWAIAARNPEKLIKLKKSLLDIDSKSMDIPEILADSYDQKSLDKMTSICRIVISTVGPYLRHGHLLVESCAKNGTHYCDLTGEVPFIKESIDQFDQIAKKNNCRIIHSCGFDSVPSDIGVLLLQREAIKQFGIPCSKIKYYVYGMGGGFSGGTIDSGIHVSEYVKDKPHLQRALRDPFSLVPNFINNKTINSPSLRSVKWDKKMNLWTCPFIMSGINTRVVRRSNALTGYSYGKDFKYSEVYSFNKGLLGFMKSISMLIGMASLKVAISFRLSLWLLRKLFLPAPGQGPSKENRESGYFKVLLVGFLDEKKLNCIVTGNRDPGYAGTAKMLSESALSLLLEKESIPDTSGVLTPASGIGNVIVARLNDKGIVFKIE